MSKSLEENSSKMPDWWLEVLPLVQSGWPLPVATTPAQQRYRLKR
jgi:hypothetical protein